MLKYFFLFEFEYMPRCKCCLANVYFCIIDKVTLNLSRNFTLMAMYRSFSMQFK